MSQDTHLFSVRRPRDTLGGLNINAHAGGIPQPTSALKRSSSSSQLPGPAGAHGTGHPPAGLYGASGAPASQHHARSQSASRMSLAPGRPPQPAFMRTSTSGTSGPRSSKMHAYSRMSFAPMQTPARPINNAGAASLTHGMQTVQRRSSVYSRPSTSGPMMAQPSFFMQAPIPAGQVADRRRLRDRGVQLQLGQELEEYLAAHNFQMEMKHALRPDTLRNPTQKDFTMIFQWLYRRIDPAYVFQKGMDAEVPPILKQLRYPFEKSITKSALMAVGGQNWPVFLGMLHWLMQLATMIERFGQEQYDYACAEEGVDVSSDRIMFRFLRDAYQTWLSSPPGDDEGEEDDVDKILAPHIEAMAVEFTQGNEQFAEQLQVLEAAHGALTQQITAAEAEAPDLAKQQAYVETLESDLKKFEAWQSNVEDKLKRHEQRNEALRKEVEDWERQLAEATRERSDLQHAVDSQGIAVADIDRMNAERERLQSGVDAAQGRVDEGSARIRERESEASDRLASLEGLVREFNSLCYDVGIRDAGYELVVQVGDEAPATFGMSQSGSGSGNGNGSGGDRLLADADTGYHPSKILNLDLRGAVKSHVHGVRRTISKRRNDGKDRDEENRRMLFEVSNAIDDKRLEVDALEHRVLSAEEEFEKTRDKLNSDAQIERAEKELAKMRAGLSESVQLMEQRELNTQFQYEQLTVRAHALREELHTEIDRILHDVCKFKMHVQDSLESYEGLVGDELDQELGTGEDDVGGGGGAAFGAEKALIDNTTLDLNLNVSMHGKGSREPAWKMNDGEPAFDELKHEGG